MKIKGHLVWYSTVLLTCVLVILHGNSRRERYILLPRVEPQAQQIEVKVAGSRIGSWNVPQLHMPAGRRTKYRGTAWKGPGTFYAPQQRSTYREPLFADATHEEPYSAYGPMCGYLTGRACASNAGEAHPGGDATVGPDVTAENPYPKSSRRAHNDVDWTDVMDAREAFNFPGKWRGKEYLNSVHAWENKMYKYSNMMSKLPGMAVGIRKLYEDGRENYYSAYRNWYRR